MKFLQLFLFLTISTSYAQVSEENAIKELAELHSKTSAVRESTRQQIKAYNLEIEAETDPANRKKLHLAVDSIWNIFDRNDIDELKIDIAYCKANPACAHSFGLINGRIASQTGKDFYYEFESIYNNASKELKESERGKSVAEKLVFFKQSMVGSVAPKFSGIDISGQQISLDDFRDKKYVLVDFWASWCGPCREEIPFMNSLRERYKEQGFEIVSISVDENLAQWKSAVKKEEIENWRHFSTIQNNSSAKQDYFVIGIPHKVLIDKEGKIIGKWKASGELNKKEMQDQLVAIFGY